MVFSQNGLHTATESIALTLSGIFSIKRWITNLKVIITIQTAMTVCSFNKLSSNVSRTVSHTPSVQSRKNVDK